MQPASSSPHDPPLVGRAEELAFIDGAMARGGCVIAGAAGVGASRLSREATHRLRGALVLRASASTSASDIPYGALAHLLPDTPAPADHQPRSVMSAYLRALRRHAAGRELVVAVEDGHQLDDPSAALLLALCSSGVGRPIVTVRRNEAAPDAVVKLWTEGHLERLDLEPLQPTETRQLVEQFLGGRADAPVHQRIHTLTEGNPLYVRELLAEARTCGALQSVDGQWRLSVDWSPHGSRLRDLVQSRTRQLSPAAREGIDLLAVGAPLALELMAGLTSWETLEELERAGIVTVHAGNGDNGDCVAFGHPLYAEISDALLPATTRRRIRGVLADEIGRRGPLDDADVLRVATWRLDLDGTGPDEDLVLAASDIALRRGDPHLAERLALGAAQGLPRQLRLAAARMQSDRFTDVETGLVPLESTAASAPVDSAATYVRTRCLALHWGGPGTEAALALLDRASAWHHGPDWQALMAALRGWILLDRSLPAQALACVEAAHSDPDLPARTRLDLLTVRALALCRLGRLTECEALEPELLAVADTVDDGAWETGWVRSLVDGAARIESARDLAGVRARLTAGIQDALTEDDGALAAAIGVMLGRLALVVGDARAAVAALDDALDWLATGDPRNAAGLAWAYLARAHALLGAVGPATEALDQAQARSTARPNNLRLTAELERSHAWVDAASGHLERAQERLLAAASSAREDREAAAIVVHDALRLGADAHRCASALDTLLEETDNDLLLACREHARAVARHDGEAQLAAARRFAALGVGLRAAEAAAASARVLGAEGHRDAARLASTLAAHHAERCPGVRTPALVATTPAAQLTRREWEVATLASEGLANAAIAADLALSIRTVETYLLRACRKVGVTNRGGLAEVMRTAPGSGP